MENIYMGKQPIYAKSNQSWGAEDSEWKAGEVIKMLSRHDHIPIKKIVEVGCGLGHVLAHLRNKLGDKVTVCEGYDIADLAIEKGRTEIGGVIKLFNEDFLQTENADYDLLLMLDVFEHVEDYIGFIEKCKSRARYKIYHIPLDLHVSALLRGQLMYAREQVGHLHYFSKETALATLKDTEQEVVDYFYTQGALQTEKKFLKTRIANIPRMLLFRLFPDLTVRLLGGYSLMVLTK